MSAKLCRKTDGDLAALFEELDKTLNVFGELMRVLPAEANVDVRAFADDPTVTLEIAREEELRHFGFDRTLRALPRRQLELRFLRGDDELTGAEAHAEQ